MFIKKCEIPLTLKKLKALLMRLPHDHPSRSLIEEDLRKVSAGYRGERALVRHLSFLKEQQYYIFHDLRLPIGDYHFQIDYLIISPLFIVIIEVKNFSGTIYFTPGFDQMVRTQNGLEETYASPSVQVLGQQSNLQSVMEKLKIPHLPIEPIVVFTNSKTLLTTADSNHKTSKNIIQKEKLPLLIQSFENKYKHEILTKKDIQKVSKTLLNLHKPYNTDLIKKYQVSENELLKGVHCPKCSTFPMQRNHGKWSCGNCLNSYYDAHLAALQDYVLLLKPTITNKELREFLHLPSRATATRILSSLNLPSSGNRKNTTYTLPTDKEIVKKQK